MWIYSHINDTGPNWCLVNISSGNEVVPSDNKTLSEPVFFLEVQFIDKWVNFPVYLLCLMKIHICSWLGTFTEACLSNHASCSHALKQIGILFFSHQFPVLSKQLFPGANEDKMFSLMCFRVLYWYICYFIICCDNSYENNTMFISLWNMFGFI